MSANGSLSSEKHFLDSKIRLSPFVSLSWLEFISCNLRSILQTTSTMLTYETQLQMQGLFYRKHKDSTTALFSSNKSFNGMDFCKFIRWMLLHTYPTRSSRTRLPKLIVIVQESS